MGGNWGKPGLVEAVSKKEEVMSVPVTSSIPENAISLEAFLEQEGLEQDEPKRRRGKNHRKEKPRFKPNDGGESDDDLLAMYGGATVKKPKSGKGRGPQRRKVGKGGHRGRPKNSQQKVSPNRKKKGVRVEGGF